MVKAKFPAYRALYHENSFGTSTKIIVEKQRNKGPKLSDINALKMNTSHMKCGGLDPQSISRIVPTYLFFFFFLRTYPLTIYN